MKRRFPAHWYNVDFSAFRSAGCQSPSAIKDMKEIMIEDKIITTTSLVKILQFLMNFIMVK